MEQTLRNIVLIGTLGLASFGMGCSGEQNKDLELSKGNIGDTEIRFIKNQKNFSYNSNTIEIYDSEGNLKLQLKYSELPNGFFQYNDGEKYEIRDHEIINKE